MSEFAPSAVSVTSFSSLFLFSCTVHLYLCYKITRQLESLGISKEATQFQMFALANK